MEKRNIELRSEEVREILGRTPQWIIRWGICVVFSVVLVLLIGSMFFYYPDIITSEVKITTEHPAVWVVAHSSGKLSDLRVKDKQQVEENTLLAVIDNSAHYKDIEGLEIFMDSLPVFFQDYNPELLLLPKKEFLLGEIQDAYTKFYSDCEDYIHFCKQCYYQKKINATQEKLNGYLSYKNTLKNQQMMQKQSTGLSQKQFERETQLFEKKTISSAEYEIANKQWLADKQVLEQTNLNISATDITIGELRQSIIELQLDYEEKMKTYKNTLRSDYEILLSKIALWKYTYLLKAEVSGIVTFTNIWSKNQQVSAGNNVFAIVSDNPGKIIGKAQIPVVGSGKVKVGQKANIKLDGYPYMEYGMISTEVSSISLIPSEKVYVVELKLPESLKTFYGKKIDFTGELTGIVEITTENMSLFMRLLNPVKYFLKRNTKQK